jgi:hypothetical protein
MAGWVVMCLAILGTALARPLWGRDRRLTSLTGLCVLPRSTGQTNTPRRMQTWFAHNEVAIQAPCSVVWNGLVMAGME